MSLFRTILAAVAAIAIASPVFAADANMQNSVQGTNNSMSQSTKINLNKATVRELVRVKGLNASKARAIVAYRKKHGDFKSTDDLMNIKGFKKMNADKMQEVQGQLTIE